MGRVIQHEIVAIRCELAARGRGVTPTCTAVEQVTPMPAASVWEEQLRDLVRLVDAGWALVLTSRLRSYCPAHADRVWDCTCRTHPDRAHLCPSHGDAAELTWTQQITPEAVVRELDRIGASA